MKNKKLPPSVLWSAATISTEVKPVTFCFLVGLWIVLASTPVDAWCPLVVSVRGSGDIEKAASLRATGVVFVAEGSAMNEAESMAKLAAQARARGLSFWIGVRTLDRAAALASADVDGLALIFSCFAKAPAKRRNVRELMEIKARGERRGAAVRRLKSLLGRKKLALCTRIDAIAPETAVCAYVPAKELIRAGVVDWVCLSAAERYNFHRLRLLRDTVLHAGLFADAASAKSKAWPDLVRQAVLGSMWNETCERAWLVGFPIDLVRRVAVDAIETHRRYGARRAVIDAAIRSGRWAVDQEVSASARTSQATVHGVAQSFAPSRDGACPLAELYVTVRGAAGAALPPLKVEIHTDDGGKPGPRVLASATIPLVAFRHEPTYRWGRALFEPAVKLRKGRRYWIYLPNASGRQGSYVWGIAAKGATARGRAWSSRYDYSKYSWIFRVYLR